MRLSPYYPSWYLLYLGRAQTFKGDHEDAIATHEMGLTRAESSDMRAAFHAALAFAHIAAGHEQLAREHMAQRLKLTRSFSVRQARERTFFKNEDDLDRLLDALRQAGLPETPPLSLPDKPSIAVLPFTNISGDTEQEYFSDGITEDLITDLSKLAGLFVIARNSTFAYKGKSVEVPQIAHELGVRYVLEGSVRRAGEQVRINAQLIDATTQGHLWAERYDGVVTNVFELQDKITAKIVTALAVRLAPDEQAIPVDRHTDNPAAYDIFLKGWSYLLRQTPKGTAKALAFFKQATELDSNYSRAYAALAQTYWNNTDEHFRGKTGVGVFESYENAIKFLRKARDKPSSQAHSLAARMLQRQRRFDMAMAEAKKAVDLAPNDPTAYETLIELLVYAGRPAEAIQFADNAMRLDPRFPGEKLFLKGMAHFAMGQPEEALAFINRALTHNPDPTRYAAIQTAALVELGRIEDAKVALGEYRGGCSGIPSLNSVMLDWPFEDVATAERLANGLIKAGLPSSPQRYYAVAPQDRLSSEQIDSTLFGKTVIGAGISPCFGDEFEVTRDQDGQIVKQGWITVFRDGVSRIEQDVICDPWITFGDFCVPIFRNPHGTPDQQDEYLLFTINDIVRFSVVP